MKGGEENGGQKYLMFNWGRLNCWMKDGDTEGDNERQRRRQWVVARTLPGPVCPARSQRHYACFMSPCRIPLERLMPGSLSQLRTCYPHAACSDLVNEFISLAAAGGAGVRTEAWQERVYRKLQEEHVSGDILLFSSMCKFIWRLNLLLWSS